MAQRSEQTLAIEMKYVRRARDITRVDKMSSNVIRHELEMESLLENFGHMKTIMVWARQSHGQWTKKINDTVSLNFCCLFVPHAVPRFHCTCLAAKRFWSSTIFVNT